MKDDPNISEKERKRRKKLSERKKKEYRAKQLKGLREYYKRLKKEKKEKEKQKQKEKEKERKKKEKERLKRLAEKKKRPVGRPKKRGPKKKRKRKKKVVPKVIVKLPPFKYKILSCKNGKQNKVMGKYRFIEQAYEKLKSLKEESDKVIYPVNFSGTNYLVESIDEYILVEQAEKNEETFLTNEYGVLVEHKTNKDGWNIIDKFRYKKEETFWVWGYDNRTERKTFMWVFENMVLPQEHEDTDYKRIYTYKNKLMIKDDNGKINLILCKTPSDAIMFYNLLEQYSKKNKVKNLLYLGDFSAFGNERKKIEQELIDLTGWNKLKVIHKYISFFMNKKGKYIKEGESK